MLDEIDILVTFVLNTVKRQRKFREIVILTRSLDTLFKTKERVLKYCINFKYVRRYVLASDKKLIILGISLRYRY